MRKTWTNERMRTYMLLLQQLNHRHQSQREVCSYSRKEKKEIIKIKINLVDFPFHTHRNIGTAPSHTAHALIPLCQYISSPFNPSLFADAPVAMMIVSAVSGSWSSWNSRQYRNGRAERSTLATVSVMIFVPKRKDCARNLSMSSGPRIPEGKPGKFSTVFLAVMTLRHLDLDMGTGVDCGRRCKHRLKVVGEGNGSVVAR